MQHDHESALGIFTGGIFELFNQMWWGIAIGVVFVGILLYVFTGKKRSKRLESYKNIPFLDDDPASEQKTKDQSDNG